MGNRRMDDGCPERKVTAPGADKLTRLAVCEQKGREHCLQGDVWIYGSDGLVSLLTFITPDVMRREEETKQVFNQIKLLHRQNPSPASSQIIHHHLLPHSHWQGRRCGVLSE